MYELILRNPAQNFIKNLNEKNQTRNYKKIEILDIDHRRNIYDKKFSKQI